MPTTLISLAIVLFAVVPGYIRNRRDFPAEAPGQHVQRWPFDGLALDVLPPLP